MKKLILLAITVFPVLLNAQDTLLNKEDGGFIFTKVNNLEATEVKNQYRSGTCWSFSGMSLFESELIRMGLTPVDLSEMYVVRMAYEMKAERYVKMHGRAQFGPGGQLHDIVEVAKKYGMLTEEEYGGMPIAYGKPHHNEMDAMLDAVVKTVVKNPNGKLSSHWRDAYRGVLDAYLGEVHEGLNPLETSKSLGIDWSAYVELTSFTDMPYNEQSVLLVPDNWTYSSYYNVRLDELVKVTKDALKAGFTLGWDADVSDRGFSFKNGVAVFPQQPWETMDKKQRDTIFNSPPEELMLTDEARQSLFNDQSTTDDHLMHITGSCIDQNGTYYFIVKNSWGTDRNDAEGYIYVSEAYFRAKTIAIMLHKDGIYNSLAKTLKL